jgi:hypothetical protein
VQIGQANHGKVEVDNKDTVDGEKKVYRWNTASEGGTGAENDVVVRVV